MKKTLLSALLAFGLVTGTAGVAYAQDDTGTETTSNDDGGDDSGKLGLLGLLGLAGLAGLKRRDRTDDRTYSTTGTQTR